VPGAGADIDNDPELSPDGCTLYAASKRTATTTIRQIWSFEVTGPAP
jgi:hypothetical protein